MLIKEKDRSEQAVKELETLASRTDLDEATRAKVERELRLLRAGEKGESNSAYFIDFHYRNHKNWAVIHDLRLEYEGNTAQIDHLMINRVLEFYVLESKSFAYGVKITERGEFLIWDRNRYVAIESPIEQNRRHVIVLERLLKGEGLLPKRMGISLQPTFRPYVLVSPKSRVLRPHRKLFDSEMVIKSDELFAQIEADIETMGSFATAAALARLIASEILENLAAKLVSYHRPATMDYHSRFGIARVSAEQQPAVESRRRQDTSPTAGEYFCYRCGRDITAKVANYCFQNKQRFGGRAYCFQCQKQI